MLQVDGRAQTGAPFRLGERRGVGAFRRREQARDSELLPGPPRHHLDERRLPQLELGRAAHVRRRRLERQLVPER